MTTETVDGWVEVDKDGAVTHKYKQGWYPATYQTIDHIYFNKKETQVATPDTGGVKHDQSKPDLSLIPHETLVEIAKVMSFGANKYGRYNYKQGMYWNRVIAAAMRHLSAFNSGENNDPESGESHIAHAMCNLVFLIDYIKNHPELDNRYKPETK